MEAITIMTIGHSTHAIEVFLGMLKAHGVELIVDVRTVPRSRRNPQFSRENLPASLAAAGIGYIHLPELGGLRKPRPDSINSAWRNESFRGYADYMQTAEFAAGIEHLLELAAERPTAVMCAEAVPWRCHRSLIGDALTARGHRVENIMSATSRTPHRMTPCARVEGATVTYPAE